MKLTMIDQRVERLLDDQLGVEDDQFRALRYKIIAQVELKEFQVNQTFILLEILEIEPIEDRFGACEWLCREGDRKSKLD